MNSILNEIRKIRKDDILRIDRTNKNRYRIVTYERNTLKTAYYFSVPIYSQTDRKLLDLTFHSYKGSCLLNGSNSTIYISDSVLLKNKHGSCRITLPSRYLTQTDRETYKPQKRGMIHGYYSWERLQAYYMRRAITGNGDNDTSVQNARPVGNPAEVRSL